MIALLVRIYLTIIEAHERERMAEMARLDAWLDLADQMDMMVKDDHHERRVREARRRLAELRRGR